MPHTQSTCLFLFFRCKNRFSQSFCPSTYWKVSPCRPLILCLFHTPASRLTSWVYKWKHKICFERQDVSDPVSVRHRWEVYCSDFIMTSRDIRLLYPPLVRKVSQTRGGINRLLKSAQKKSTFMNIIDSLLSLFRVGPPQARKFLAFCTRLARFLAVFQRKIDKNTTKMPKIIPPAAGRFPVNPPPLFEKCH